MIAFCDYVVVLTAVFFVVWFFMLIKYRNQALGRKRSLILHGIVAMIPFAWYVLVANHSHIHYFFSFRTLGTFFFAMFVFEMSCFELKKRKKSEHMLDKIAENEI